MAAKPTRKSHKPKRQWKRPVELGDPESSVAAVGSSTDNTAPVNEIAELLSPSTEKPAVEDAAVKPLQPEKPYWYRPPDSKARKLFEKIAVMRAAGRDDEFIAKKLGTTYQSVRQYVYLAKMNGWADDDGEPVDLEAELALNVDRKIVRNISHSLDGNMTNWQTHEMTIAAAKGRGVFKNHDTASGQQQQSMPVVAIQVIMPTVGVGDQQVVEANVGGVPAFEEGEVLNVVDALGRHAEPSQASEPAVEPGHQLVPVGR